jgi:hypothetical protein
MENKQLRHVVMFKFKEEATDADKAFVVKCFEELAGAVPGVTGFEWGTDNSPEGRSQGFTHIFVVSFGSEADRDFYLPHDEHKAFGGKVRQFIGGVLVVDYWAN